MPPDVEETRSAYDTVAESYAELVADELDHRPFDRAMLRAFAELVTSGGGGPVADLGCGTGRVAAHLSGLGLDAFGVDLSPEMIRVARRRHPELSFHVGSMTALELPDGGLAGAVAWYSVIHTPPERRPALFAEFARVLAPAAPLLLAFQVGDHPRRLGHAYGHDIALTEYRLRPERVEGVLVDAGFALLARLVRRPVNPEPTPQAYLLASRTPRPAGQARAW